MAAHQGLGDLATRQVPDLEDGGDGGANESSGMKSAYHLAEPHQQPHHHPRKHHHHSPSLYQHLPATHSPSHTGNQSTTQHHLPSQTPRPPHLNDALAVCCEHEAVAAGDGMHTAVVPTLLLADDGLHTQGGGAHNH